MIYFTSDFHAYHKNMCYSTTTWTDKDKMESKCRDFFDVEDMTLAIIKSINDTVNEDDTLYFIGDWSLGGWERIWEFRKQIKCKNIIFINGNHDRHIINDKFFPHLYKDDDGKITEIENVEEYRFQNKEKNKNDVTARDMFTAVYDVLYIEIDGIKIVLSHEPFEQWRDMNKGSIHIHGHAHHSLDNSVLNISFRRKDVGWKDGKIYSWDEIKMDMLTREIKERY